jgi:hypothetical protein
MYGENEVVWTRRGLDMVEEKNKGKTFGYMLRIPGSV